MGAFGKTMMDTYVDEAGYVPILYTDADYVALWSYHGARTQNGVKFADVGLIRI